MAMMASSEESLRAFGHRYRLLEFIGEGSSARVYLAEDLTLRRRVALKILRVELADDASLQDRFAAEMRATSVLNHPRVLPVYDWGLDPQPYSVTEYLTGGSLAMLLSAGHRLTPSQALVVGLEAARALVNIHGDGRAHLGLGASAILFDSGARPYISDLGLSAALLPGVASDDEAPGDLEDVIEGSAETPADRAPEAGTEPPTEPEEGSDEPGAAAGSYSTLEQTQDVHDLALLLCEAVTGSRVMIFDEGDDASMASFTALGPLQAVLVRAAADEPAQRLSAADLAQELLRVASLFSPPDPRPLPSQNSPAFSAVAVPHDQTEDFARVGPSVSERSAVPLDDVPRRRWPGIMLAAILVLGGALAGAWALFVRGADHHAVPELEGRSSSAATLIAVDLGWEVNKILVRESGTSPEQVVRTEPPAGAYLDEGATLGLFVSLGEPLVAVSEFGFLYNMTVPQARDELEERGLDPSGETLVNDAVIPAGRVVGLDVEVGVYELEVGAEVGLLVSDGPFEAG